MNRMVVIPVLTVASVSVLAVRSCRSCTPTATKAFKIRDNRDPALSHWGPAGSGALPAGRAPT